MKLALNEYSALLAFSFVNGLIYSVLFWIRAWREERKSDLIFGFVILASCLYIMDWMLGFMGIHILGEGLRFFPYEIGFIIGPLILFYLKTQLNSYFKFTQKDLWHLLPYGIYVLYHLLIFVQGETFVKSWLENTHWPLHFGDIEMILILISNLTYLFWAYQLYQQYSKWLPSQFSDTESISFSWYRRFILLFALAILVNWIFTFMIMSGINLSYTDIWWEKFLVAVIIYYLCLKGYAQVQSKAIYFKQEENTPSIGALTETQIIDLDLWKTKILTAMQQDKAYLDPNITLTDLSKQLKTHNSQLSAVINQGFGKNFNDFINEFRVNDFQEKIKLPENQRLSLLGIAFDCGFNSKATFNRAVKKATGKSPKEFGV